ncbi:MAG: L-fuculose phosphate aldolase [Phycisphaerae bacterium]|nr:L-fuculose phosphate aldolase [Phycisphaerae bacterium]
MNRANSPPSRSPTERHLFPEPLQISLKSTRKHVMSTLTKLAEEMCNTGWQLAERGFLAGSEGNISARISATEILCTPSGVSKADMQSTDLCVVGLDGVQQSGRRKMSSEVLLHLAIYLANPATQAVVHCHAPHATAFAISGQAPPAGLLAEIEYFLQEIPLLEYRLPGTNQLAELITPHAITCRAALMKYHGAVTWDSSLQQARWNMEMLDAYCRALLLARSLGPWTPMTSAQIHELRTAGTRNRTDG